MIRIVAVLFSASFLVACEALVAADAPSPLGSRPAREALAQKNSDASGKVSPDTLAKEGKPTINLNAPAAPSENVEARLALRQYRPVSALNRFIFRGNVLEGIGDHVDHWIVMFCPGWHDKCQGLLPSYELLGVQWENKRNKELVMSSNVRFAKVDCATEKELCVSLDIDDYPSVVHYRNNQRVNSWHGGAPGLVRFVKQELEGIKKRSPRPAKSKAPSTCTMEDAPDQKQISEGSHYQLEWLLNAFRFASSPWRSLCFVAMLLAVTHSAWGLVSGGIRPTMLASKAKTAVAQVITERGNSGPPNSLQASLPREWACERQSIDL